MHDLCTKSAVELTRLLASRDVSSEEVTRAHIDRIDQVDGKVRAFTAILRDEALVSARRADEERRRGEVRGPLHGLPVSIKESIDMAGHASTLGARSRRDLVSTEDGGVVELLREAGAVILGRTNVSQLLLFHECRNSVFGQTANPWSLIHTPGGSSGGEAAAIAAGMSPLGVGGDVGGSIRVPAHFSGIAGLKPTLDRWPNKGSNTVLLGQEGVRSQLGPMARTAADLALAMRALDPKRMSEIDARVPPLPFQDPATIDVSKLRVGVYTDDGLLPPSQAVIRAVNEAAAALRARGAQVVAFTPPGIEDTVYEYFAAMSADGGATALKWLEGDEVDPSLQSLRALARLPSAARATAARVAGLAGEARLRRFLLAVGEKTIAEYWRIIAALRAARTSIGAAMKASSLDLLLCPAHATPALPHGLSRDFVLAGSPSILWNVVQFPAGVVPVTRVRASEAVRERPRDRMERRAVEVDARSAGLPVGVQVVGRPWDDESVLAAMIAIEEGVSGGKEFPVRPAIGYRRSRRRVMKANWILLACAATAIVSACGGSGDGSVGGGGSGGAGDGGATAATGTGGAATTAAGTGGDATTATTGSMTTTTTTATTATGTGGGGTGGAAPSGACINATDDAALGDQMTVEAKAGECGQGCFLNPNKAQCAGDCMKMKLGLTDGCAACWGGVIGCGMDKCIGQCIGGQDKPECKMCTAMNCEPAFKTCSGLQ